MARKKQEEEHGESAPMWIVSFADLVTLMLSFFVILAAGNNKDSASDPEFADLVAALKATFSHVEATTEKSLDPKADFKELIKKLSALQPPKVERTPEEKKGFSEDQGVKGKHFRVTRIREGLELAMGGPVFFQAFSPKPTPQGEQQLKDIVQILRGHRNVIEIRGHVGESPWPADWTYDDAMKLAYDRANYVGHVLRKEGIDPRAIRLVAVGPNEPLKSNDLNPESANANRRVEIIIRESLIDDYTPDPAAKGGTPAQRTTTGPAGPKNDPWLLQGPYAN